MIRVVYFSAARDFTHTKTIGLLALLAASSDSLVLLQTPQFVNGSWLSLPLYLKGFVSVLFKSLLLRSNSKSIFILSEWKYHSFFWKLFAKFIARIYGSSVISGPHVLRSDLYDLSFINPNHHSIEHGLVNVRSPHCLTPFQKIIDLPTRLFNTTAGPDILQSYSVSYANRVIRAECLNITYQLFPLVILADHSYSHSCDTKADSLRIVFWGDCTGLHGLDIIPLAMQLLQENILDIHFSIFSRPTPWLVLLKSIVRDLHMDHLFTFSNRRLSGSWDLLKGYDLAISHIISDKMNSEGYSAATSVATNKMIECASIGLPVIVADTPAVREYFNDGDCLWVEPASPASLADLLKCVSSNKEQLVRISDNLSLAFRTRLSVEARAIDLRNDLHTLSGYQI